MIAYLYFSILQLEAANRRVRDLEEQVALEMQSKDELDHNYRSDNLDWLMFVKLEALNVECLW